eukprot:4347080-Pleurochrysis_carterae.AAC.1
MYGSAATLLFLGPPRNNRPLPYHPARLRSSPPQKLPKKPAHAFPGARAPPTRAYAAVHGQQVGHRFGI